MPKILVLAGTHQREIEFSHPVADLLLAEYGASKPSARFVGEDNATRAEAYDLGELVVAKLYAHRTGEPSKKWLRRQSPESLLYLARHKLKNGGQERPPRVAEAYGGNGQWTSVHDPLIQTYLPHFFIDLHSYHVTNTTVGCGMQINSHADRKLDPVMAAALQAAQAAEPVVYGSTQPKFTSGREIRARLFSQFFPEEKLLGLLSEPLGDRSEKLRALEESCRALEREVDIIMEEETARANDAGWYFVQRAPPEPRGSYYCFEAKHWQRNQQVATAAFITKYLLPEVNRGAH